MPRIFIDAGHGGKDFGAMGNDLHEKDVVLDIALKIKKGLSAYKDTEILLSREKDAYLSLDERTDKANAWRADVLISIHNNSFKDKSAKGFESYIYSGNVSSGTIAFQNVLHAEIMREVGAEVEERGKRRANFHMLRESNMKAVLTENLFLSNASDANLLKNDDFRQKIANGHIIGVAKFLGLQPIKEKPINEKFYRVQVGAFEDVKNAEALQNDLIKLGFRPYIKYE